MCTCELAGDRHDGGVLRRRAGGFHPLAAGVQHHVSPKPKGTLLRCIWSGVLVLVLVRFEHQWTPRAYLDFLAKQGWRITRSREMAAWIALMYAECVREENP